MSTLARDIGKRCTKCGGFKPPSEFNVHRKLKNGGVILQPKCKACHRKRASERKRKTDCEYRTIQQIREQSKNQACEYCGLRGKQHKPDCQRPRLAKLNEWEKLCRRAYLSLQRKPREKDPWRQRCENAMVSLRRRAPSKGRPIPSLATMKALAMRVLNQEDMHTYEPSNDWAKKIPNAISSLRKRARKRASRACTQS